MSDSTTPPDATGPATPALPDVAYIAVRAPWETAKTRGHLGGWIGWCVVLAAVSVILAFTASSTEADCPILGSCVEEIAKAADKASTTWAWSTLTGAGAFLCLAVALWRWPTEYHHVSK
ncbi:hypothetical protein [Streptomyces sp. NPDC090029]|uniref:hypothetical protein n=1 Tax=Streptomyces sp. NPDC090029 TaxID=3365924 RepID=UPI0038184052